MISIARPRTSLLAGVSSSRRPKLHKHLQRMVRRSFFLALLSSTHAAGTVLPSQEECAAIPCGFSFTDALPCGTFPANHQIELRVMCSRDIDPAAFPRLRLADGTEVPSTWEQRTRPFELSPFLTGIGYDSLRSLYGNNESVYVRTGPELPVGEVVEIAGHVPATCASVLSTEMVLHDGLGTNLLCWDHSDDCCATYAAHDVPFPVRRTSDGPVSVDVDWQPNYTYLRFRTTESDLAPPPELPLQIDCRIDRGRAEYRIDLTLPSDDLDDVVEVEVLARRAGEDELLAAVLRASSCRDGEARTFELSPGLVGQRWGFREEISDDWTFFLRAHDASGNASTGPEVLLHVPGDCVETSDLSARQPLVAVCSSGSLSGGTDWCSGNGQGGAGGVGGETPGDRDPSWLDHELPSDCPGPSEPGIPIDDRPPATGGTTQAGTGGWSGSRRGRDDAGCGCRLGGSTSSPPVPGWLLLIAGLSCWGVRRVSSRRRGFVS